MRAAAVVIGLICAGCATVDPPAPRVTVVEKPIPVPCAERVPERPTFALERLNDRDLKTASDYELVLTLWVERAERIAYEAELEAALAGCRWTR